MPLDAWLRNHSANFACPFEDSSDRLHASKAVLPMLLLTSTVFGNSFQFPVQEEKTLALLCMKLFICKQTEPRQDK